MTTEICRGPGPERAKKYVDSYAGKSKELGRSNVGNRGLNKAELA